MVLCCVLQTAPEVGGRWRHRSCSPQGSLSAAGYTLVTRWHPLSSGQTPEGELLPGQTSSGGQGVRRRVGLGGWCRGSPGSPELWKVWKRAGGIRWWGDEVVG